MFGRNGIFVRRRYADVIEGWLKNRKEIKMDVQGRINSLQRLLALPLEMLLLEGLQCSKPYQAQTCHP